MQEANLLVERKQLCCFLRDMSFSRHNPTENPEFWNSIKTFLPSDLLSYHVTQKWALKCTTGYYHRGCQVIFASCWLSHLMLFKLAPARFPHMWWQRVAYCLTDQNIFQIIVQRKLWSVMPGQITTFCCKSFFLCWPTGPCQPSYNIR